MAVTVLDARRQGGRRPHGRCAVALVARGALGRRRLAPRTRSSSRSAPRRARRTRRSSACSARSACSSRATTAGAAAQLSRRSQARAPTRFASSRPRIDAEFAGRLEAHPSVVRSPAAEARGAAPLENTGVFVRVCEKKRGDDGVAHPRPFTACCSALGRPGSTRRRLPTPPIRRSRAPSARPRSRWGCTCARCRRRRARSPQASRCSRTWAARASRSTRPARTCLASARRSAPSTPACSRTGTCARATRSSTLPEDFAYHGAFQEHFSRASKLYLSLTDAAPLQRAAPSSRASGAATRRATTSTRSRSCARRRWTTHTPTATTGAAARAAHRSALAPHDHRRGVRLPL